MRTLIALALVFALAACGGGSGEPAPQPSGQVASQTAVTMFACPDDGLPTPAYAQPNRDSAVLDTLHYGDDVTVLHVSADGWATLDGFPTVTYAEVSRLRGVSCTSADD